MVLVDSSVWVDYLSHRTSEVEARLESLLRPFNQIVITGMIFQEVLQGVRNETSFLLTQKLLGRFPFLQPTMMTHTRAAGISRKLLLKGNKPHTVDAFIAALAIENQVPLFTLDADFQRIHAHSDLKLY